MNYRVITDLSSVKNYLQGAVLLAFDFETAPDDAYRDEPKAALDAHKAHIVSISFSVAEGDAIHVPLKHRVGENCAQQTALWAFLKAEVFENPHLVKIAHHLAFEAMFLYAKGIVLQAPVYDTIAAAQMTLKNYTEYRKLSDSGLKKLATDLCGAEMSNFESVTNGRHFDELNPQDAQTIRYACADADYALRLYHLFNAWFDRYLPKHRSIVEEIESPTAVYCGLMKYNGLPIDKEAMLQWQAEAETKLMQIRSDIAFVIGDVNIGANAATIAFKKYLFEDLKLPVLKTTAQCREAADDETMILLREYCRENRPELTHLFDLVQEYRKWGKLKSTYIDGYLQYINTATGRIHPDLFPLGTDTGRFAARNPNLQNMPRKDNDPIGVRNFIVAPKGQLILSLDFSQVELRVGAFYCRDEKMLETYRSGGDIHAQTTAVIFHIPFVQAADKNAPHYKERRTIAKNCNFGVFFGLFPRGLQHTLKFKADLDTPLAECEGIIANLNAGYPQLATWQAAVKHEAAQRQYAETYFGRRRYLPGIASQDWNRRSFAQRCAMNSPIQGTAAEILKLAMGRIVAGMPARLWLRPLLQIHDELVFEIPAEKLAEAISFVKTCMETQPFPAFDLPLIAEAAAGESFGSLKELEDL
ncbi:MAG: bifunctional 3'-5' exonuclease/DNA polymerase [Ruthenibacterium sp.]